MSWFEAVPPALVFCGWLALPGLPITYLLGLRGVAAWGFAPTVATGIVGVTAVLAPMAGLTWGFLPPLAATVALSAVLGVYRLFRRGRSGPVDPRGVRLWAALGLVPALLLGVVTVLRAIPAPGSVAQTFDNIFHYNAVRLILDSGNGSSLSLSALGQPGAPAGFYPAVWHDLAALTVQATGVSIPVAANAAAIAMSTIAWPLACLLLVRQIIGPSRLAMALTGVLSLAFGAFPWGLLGFGVLWPNTLGLALLPAGVAGVLAITGLAREDVLGKGRAWLLLAVTFVAGGLAHPNTIFSLAVLSVVPIAIAVVRWGQAKRAAGKPGLAWVGMGGALVAALALARFVDTSPLFNDVKAITRPPIETPAQAVGEALLNGPNSKSAAWLLSAFVLVGLYVTLRRGSTRRWLAANHVISMLMFVIAATTTGSLAQHIVGYWYNDSFRLAAVLPVTALPLAIIGVLAAIAFIRDRIETMRSDAWRTRLQPALKSTIAIPALVALALLGGTKGFYSGEHSRVVTAIYGLDAKPATQPLLDTEQRAFFDRISRDVPADAVIASNPWNGSVLLWSLESRKVLVPAFNLAMGPDQTFLAKHLDDAATNPLVCAAANRLHVRYVYVDTRRFWPTDKRIHDYPGLADPTGRSGFELVDQQGAMKLFRITACAAQGR
ncbi:DUF6541 family protein [Kutzneria sp. NPDC052558]|uniref:DUF6541 family protein n=1 Tax=Kutzneria sp. NPDC052558 TaxID=3364121 RepID=UPI0037C6B31F